MRGNRARATGHVRFNHLIADHDPTASRKNGPIMHCHGLDPWIEHVPSSDNDAHRSSPLAPAIFNVMAGYMVGRARRQYHLFSVLQYRANVSAMVRSKCLARANTSLPTR
jgi:hypothetical protein